MKKEERNKKDNMAKWNFKPKDFWIGHRQPGSTWKLLGFEKRHSTGSEQQVSRK